jgi:Kdo2-lipid IVA lauroyltransferase/acyltransferase
MTGRRLRHAVEFAAFRAAWCLLRIVPHTVARRLGRGLGALAHGLLGGRRRIVEDNLRRAFPDRSEAERRQIHKECFRRFGMAVCDALSAERFDARELCRRLTLEGWEHLDAAEGEGSDGRGTFIMSAHLGCWEMAAQPIALYAGGMEVVGRPMDNPYLDRYLKRLRGRFGNGGIDKRGAARGMLRTLRQGGRVGILIDQRPRRGEGVEVPFFGQPTRAVDVLARLSLRTGAPVVPIFGHDEPGGRYRVVLREPIFPPETTQGEDAAVVALTARYLKVVEEEIRRDPASWLWLHERWKA